MSYVRGEVPASLQASSLTYVFSPGDLLFSWFDKDNEDEEFLGQPIKEIWQDPERFFAGDVDGAILAASAALEAECRGAAAGACFCSRCSRSRRSRIHCRVAAVPRYYM